jgi:hypothetical protein
MIVICAPGSSRPSLVRGSYLWWKREPYHVRSKDVPDMTRCGENCTEWLLGGMIEALDDRCCPVCRIA